MPIPESDVITSCPGDKCDSTKGAPLWCASKNSGNLYHCNPFTKLKDVNCIGNKDNTTLFDGKTQSQCEQLCKQDSTCTVFSWKGSGDVGECRTRSGDPPDFKWGGCGETVWAKDYWEKIDPVTCDPDNAPNCDNTHQFCRTYDVPGNIHKWWSCSDGKWSLEQYITDQIPAPHPSPYGPDCRQDPGCCNDVINVCCCE